MPTFPQRCVASILRLILKQEKIKRFNKKQAELLSSIKSFVILPYKGKHSEVLFAPLHQVYRDMFRTFSNI